MILRNLENEEESTQLVYVCVCHDSRTKTLGGYQDGFPKCLVTRVAD